MAEEHVDPSGSTEAFRAFVRRADEEPKAGPKGSNKWVLVGGVAAVIIIVVVLVIALR